MPHVVLRDMKSMSGTEVSVITARKHDTWGVLPQGASSPSAVSGEKLLVDSGMKMPVSLVDVLMESKEKDGDKIFGKADAFRAERWGWSVILPSSKPGSASLVKPGDLYEKGSKDAWVAPVRLETIMRNDKEQRGLFASIPLLPGDCIFVESPCMVIPEEADIDENLGGLYVNKAHKTAIQAFIQLPVQLKKYVLEMFCPERLLVTLSDRKKQWVTPVSKEMFFEQLAKVGIEVGSDESDKEVIWRFIRTWDANCMQVAAGVGLFPWGGRVNHSCRPNAARVMLPGNQIAYFAIEAIAPDDEILTSYLIDEDLLKPRERRHVALEPWDFKCECSRCSEAEDVCLTCQEEDDIDAQCASMVLSMASGDTLDLSETRSELSKISLAKSSWLRPRVDAAFRDLEELEGNYPAARDRQAAIVDFWDTQLSAKASIRRAHLRGVLGDHEKRLGNYMAALRLYSAGLVEVSSFQFPAHTTCEELK